MNSEMIAKMWALLRLLRLFWNRSVQRPPWLTLTELPHKPGELAHRVAGSLWRLFDGRTLFPGHLKPACDTRHRAKRPSHLITRTLEPKIAEGGARQARTSISSMHSSSGRRGGELLSRRPRRTFGERRVWGFPAHPLQIVSVVVLSNLIFPAG